VTARTQRLDVVDSKVVYGVARATHAIELELLRVTSIDADLKTP
jgi:hypothetical protein